MLVLGIETSCDETAAAVVSDQAPHIRSNVVFSQLAEHRPYGGIVPEVAARAHLTHLDPVIERALEEAGVGFDDLDAVAATGGPGLIGGVIVGVTEAKAIALARGLPFVAINHLEGHALSARLVAPVEFPFLLLLVSGGHCQLQIVEGIGHYRRLGTTIDDAAGEAFDKGAKLLGLGYPGGPLIEKLAQSGRPDAFNFPRGIGRRDELDFSFSGVKTSLRYQIEKMTAAQVQERLPDLCASYQQAVLDALVRKTRAALRQAGGVYRSLGLSGGVANNRTLRVLLEREAQGERIPFFAAQPKHTGDNAGMIAFAAWIDPKGCDGSAGFGLLVEPSATLAPLAPDDLAPAHL